MFKKIDCKMMKIKSFFKEPSSRLIAPFIIIAIWIACSHLRPLCILFLSILTIWYYKTQCNWRIVPPPELRQNCERIRTYFIMMREPKSKVEMIITFCPLLIALISGLFVSSFCNFLMMAFAIVFALLYEFKIEWIREPEKMTQECKETEYEEEFMPEVNDSTKYVLENASTMTAPISGTDDTINEESDDELPSDSIPDLSDNSTDEEVDKLLPVAKKSQLTDIPQAAPAAIAVASTVDSMENIDAMRFRKGHFKRDSSLSTSASSSEESLSKGLKFPDVTVVDGIALRKLPAATEETETPAPAAATAALLLQSNAAKLLPNLVSGIVQWSIGTNAAVIATEAPAVSAVASNNQSQSHHFTGFENSDDESDFEIVDKDEYLK